MNLDDLRHKLILAARATPPPDTVPAGFERRILHRLKGLHAVDAWAFWSTALWRATAPYVAVALVLAAWSFLSSQGISSSQDISLEFENTVFAAANSDQPPAEPLR